jgi:antitoxin component YwqK of YwqJK toxin-antitoxin module
MRNLLLILILITTQISAQDVLKNDDIYPKNNIFYRKDNNQLFSGKAQSFKSNGRLFHESIFFNGKITSRIEYYNSKKPTIQYELIYDEFGNLNKQIEFSKDQKQKSISYFDWNGIVKIKEEYVNDQLVSRCEYTIRKK